MRYIGLQHIGLQHIGLQYNGLRNVLAVPLMAVCLLLTALSASAVIETYEFDDDVTRERYNRFTEELRCQQCQNQNLSGSNSAISRDLRRELYRLLQEGRSDQQITDYMVERYGDFILYRPRFNMETAILWLAPAIFLFFGVIILITIAVKQRRKAVAAGVDSDLTLDDAERERLDSLLGAETGSDRNDQRDTGTKQ